MSPTTRTRPDIPRALAAAQPGGSHHRILVAEEVPELLEAIVQTLQGGGYTAIPVRAAHELLATVEDAQLVPDEVAPFEAVICDVSLSGTGRGPLLSLLRRMSPDVPVIVMTDPDDPLTHAEAFRRNADAVFDKPFDLHHLLTVLRIIAPIDGPRSG